MLRFLKDRLGRRGERPLALGHLEIRVMEILWKSGESSVHDVAGKLDRPLAYTTVMTTLDRLYKKGMLERRKAERAFLYLPRLSHRDWERQRAGDFVASVLAAPQASRELLISCLVEAVGDYDTSLLHELEQKVRTKRRDLNRKRKS